MIAGFDMRIKAQYQELMTGKLDTWSKEQRAEQLSVKAKLED